MKQPYAPRTVSQEVNSAEKERLKIFAQARQNEINRRLKNVRHDKQRSVLANIFDSYSLIISI